MAAAAAAAVAVAAGTRPQPPGGFAQALAELASTFSPTARLHCFERLCALYQTSPLWDDHSAAPWQWFDDEVGIDLLHNIDNDIIRYIFEFNQRRRTTTGDRKKGQQQHQQPQPSRAPGSDNVSRMRHLRTNTPWRLLPHHVLRDLHRDACVNVGILRALDTDLAQVLVDGRGRPIPWATAAKACKAASEARMRSGQRRDQDRQFTATDVRSAVAALTEVPHPAFFKKNGQESCIVTGTNITRRRHVQKRKLSLDPQDTRRSTRQQGESIRNTTESDDKSERSIENGRHAPSDLSDLSGCNDNGVDFPDTLDSDVGSVHSAHAFDDDTGCDLVVDDQPDDASDDAQISHDSTNRRLTHVEEFPAIVPHLELQGSIAQMPGPSPPGHYDAELRGHRDLSLPAKPAQLVQESPLHPVQAAAARPPSIVKSATDVMSTCTPLTQARQSDRPLHFEHMVPTTPDGAPVRAAIEHVVPATVANLLRVRSIRSAVEPTPEGMLQSLQPGSWLSASAVAASIISFNPNPEKFRVFESGYLDLHSPEHCELKGRSSSRSHDVHIFPVCTDNLHFVLGIVDLAGHTIEVFDPLGPNVPAKALEAIARYAKGVSDTIWKRIPAPNLQQPNQYDCGVYVAVRAVMVMHRKECPPSIVGEVWRRAFIYHLSDLPSHDPKGSETIVSGLKQALASSATYSSHTAADPFSAASEKFKLGQCLSVLVVEARMIIALYRARFTPASARSIIDYLEKTKREMPLTLPDDFRRVQLAEADSGILKQQAYLQRHHTERDDVVHSSLDADVEMYARHAEMAKSEASSIISRVLEGAREVLQVGAALQEAMSQADKTV